MRLFGLIMIDTILAGCSRPAGRSPLSAVAISSARISTRKESSVTRNYVVSAAQTSGSALATASRIPNVSGQWKSASDSYMA
jgi:hypothetical protein